MTKPLISVVMPLYGKSNYLHQAIDSILGQSFAFFELIIVEDPSAHLSSEVVRSYSDSRIRYVLNEKRTSLSEQLNKGISLATADFIARMDGDDVAKPNRLQEQYDFLISHPHVDILGSAVDVVDFSGRVTSRITFPLSDVEIKKEFRFKNCLIHPSVMAKTSAFKQFGFYDPAIKECEDYELWSRWISRGAVFANSPHSLLQFRFDLSRSNFSRYPQRFFWMTRIKNTCFRSMSGWTFFAEIRYRVDQLFSYFPAWGLKIFFICRRLL